MNGGVPSINHTTSKQAYSHPTAANIIISHTHVAHILHQSKCKMAPVVTYSKGANCTHWPSNEQRDASQCLSQSNTIFPSSPSSIRASAPNGAPTFDGRRRRKKRRRATLNEIAARARYLALPLPTDRPTDRRPLWGLPRRRLQQRPTHWSQAQCLKMTTLPRLIIARGIVMSPLKLYLHKAVDHLKGCLISRRSVCPVLQRPCDAETEHFEIDHATDQIRLPLNYTYGDGRQVNGPEGLLCPSE